jgi:hypothetical protein
VAKQQRIRLVELELTEAHMQRVRASRGVRHALQTWTAPHDRAAFILALYQRRDKPYVQVKQAS